MNAPAHGFHPVQRLVGRLARIAPHRQIQLLCAISVAILLVIVATSFVALTPTERSLRVSSERLVPAIEKIDVAREKYVAAQTALQGIVNTDPGTRAATISFVTSLNSQSEAAWSAYVRISSHLPGERKLQRKFLAHRKAGLDAGGTFVSKPAPTAEDLQAVSQQTDALRLDLNGIKELYESNVQRSLRDGADEVDATRREVMIVSGIAFFILLITFGVATRSARSREQRLETLDRALHEDAERTDLESRLQRSLEMSSTEAAGFKLVGRALSMCAPGVSAELLVADSSRAHFQQVATSNGGPGCPVMSPADCPATTWGQTQVWSSSAALDACPHLQDRPGGECSAVCVPVSIGGKTVGIVHATGEDTQPPNELVVARIELVARKLSERIGMLRAFRRSETQAHTDPLTGLMNRRSVEEKVRALTEEGRTYVAAYGDLDHFKQLNDVHGHEAGDQALRLFARVLRDAVRPDDLTARYGGEEFVVVLPDCQISDAYAVINRLRSALANAQAGASMPAFTVSFGITAARPEHTFSETLEIADAALLKAKATGRDRIVISADSAPDPTPTSTPEAIEPQPLV